MGQEMGSERRPKSAANVEGILLDLQILGVLRVLGRGTCSDGIKELTNALTDAHRVFFFINSARVSAPSISMNMYI